MNESHEIQKTHFEQKQLNDKIEADHGTALQSEKLGKKLVSKTVKLMNSGKSEKSFFSPTLSREKADPESTSLALNSELRSQGIDVKAAVTTEWDGSVGDPGYYNLLRLTEVEGKIIAPPAKSLHRDRK